MKIATYNVNSIRAREGLLLAWLKREQPDVICLQETKVQDKDFPISQLNELGYHCNFVGQKSYNGVAILSTKPLTQTVRSLDDSVDDTQARLICGEISGVTILNTYIPQGQEVESEKFTYKLQWFKRLRAFLETHFSPDQLIVWTGDLNVAPEPIDVYAPDELLNHVCFHPEVRRMLEYIKEWGFIDVFRKHVPEPHHYSFWDFRTPNAVGRQLGWRIDHIMATKPMAEYSRHAWIDVAQRLVVKPSDHTFVIAEFDYTL